MKQTKIISAIESSVNVLSGLIISFLIQLWIYPFLDIKVTLYDNIFITLMFFVASFVRSYIVRRIFNNFE